MLIVSVFCGFASAALAYCKCILIKNDILCFRLINQRCGWCDIYHKIEMYSQLVEEVVPFACGNSKLLHINLNLGSLIYAVIYYCILFTVLISIVFKYFLVDVLIKEF